MLRKNWACRNLIFYEAGLNQDTVHLNRLEPCHLFSFILFSRRIVNGNLDDGITPFDDFCCDLCVPSKMFCFNDDVFNDGTAEYFKAGVDVGERNSVKQPGRDVAQPSGAGPASPFVFSGMVSGIAKWIMDDERAIFKSPRPRAAALTVVGG